MKAEFITNGLEESLFIELTEQEQWCLQEYGPFVSTNSVRFVLTEQEMVIAPHDETYAYYVMITTRPVPSNKRGFVERYLASYFPPDQKLLEDAVKEFSDFLLDALVTSKTVSNEFWN